MAKSLRSKWRRKCRAVKRIRYGQKELERLKKTLGIDDTKNEVDMQEVSEVATVVDAKKVKEEAATASTTAAKPSANENDMDTNESKRVFDPKTYRDQNGSYPLWMHKRKIKTMKKNYKNNCKLSRKKRK